MDNINTNLVSYETLLEQFELTKKELGSAEENIKRLTGRDPDLFTKDGKGGQSGLNKWRQQPGLTPNKPFLGRNKRPLFPIIKIKEDLAPQDEDSPEEEIPAKRPSLSSTVVASTKDVKSRKETIQEQNINSKVKARNRRMFGLILGTLQKFQHDAKKTEDKDLKRAKIEQKVEAAAAEEKERIKKEKEELFQTRREKQTQLRCLEKKLEIAELHDVWEKNQKHMINVIMTTTQPSIAFLPATHTPASRKRLEESKSKALELIREHREKMEKELLEVEEWYKKDNFPSDKENIGPSEDGLDELAVTQGEQSSSHDLPDTHQELPVAHNEFQDTQQKLQNSPEKLQNTHQELSENTLKMTETENKYAAVSNDNISDKGDEENEANEQSDQDFEPIYD